MRFPRYALCGWFLDEMIERCRSLDARCAGDPSTSVEPRPRKFASSKNERNRWRYGRDRTLPTPRYSARDLDLSSGDYDKIFALDYHDGKVNGVAIVNVNFRELHVSEQPALLRPLVMPLVRTIQRTLRENGQPLFDALAKPGTVKQILKEPYYDASTVTDELVDVLLSPLLLEGSADVVFDTLSYSAGPLPEQLLGSPKLKAPVWVCWGERDPWTPSARVQALDRFDSVERVVPLADVGHCPHDEAPQLVNPLLIDFVKRACAE